ncbi:L-ribulose-5-phosphate 3-epimerase [Pseudarthrobacter siccitolerans]|uniref:L-ribulose-5-phosphate 3-epimerase n=1 Tax=Pseudarthrobacter siccitolerans TaxID=861266 RepID=A0ABU0PMH1_9MICC|nr:sugar phosphate isomerase/epimerase [Pseudarthrobacter siccitolerans]MDQ0675140.1 L-ribulose-5-phosphate 3-epimerase [Pseudarthrobacter siccitolerans]
MNNDISFMGANLVAQQLDWNMTEGWNQGDSAANDWYRPISTFEERFDAFVQSAVHAGFDTLDVWHPQLNYEWATDEHITGAQRVLQKHGVTVASYGSSYGDTVKKFRRANEIAKALGTNILGGQTPLLLSDRTSVIGILKEFGNVLGLENHPQKSAAELLDEIGNDHDGVIGATVDTGWFGTQGFDAAQAIRELGSNVFYVHLKDVRAVGAHDTCAYGDGIVPIEDCVRALNEIGYDRPISIEHEPEHYNPFPEVLRSRARLLELLEETEMSFT